MPGLRARLGGFADRVIKTAQGLGRSLGETLGILQPIAPEIEPMAAARDWGSVSTGAALEPQIAALRPDESVPRDLFTTSNIPWADKYAYQVTIFGRDRATGRFANQAFDMTVGREMTVQEVLDTARARFGGYEGSKMSEVFDAAVTGAWKSAEVEW